VRFVELQVRARVDHQRPLAPALVDLARGEREELHPRGEQRPAIEVDDRLKVRGLGAEARDRALHERLLVGLAQELVVPALVTDGGGHLQVDPRAAAHRAAEMPRPHLGLV
jgi:hypothetical protein